MRDLCRILSLICLSCWSICVTGCASSGSGFTIFPAGNFLLDTTKDLRDAAPAQPDLPRELSKTVLADYIIQPGDVLLVEPEALDSPIRFPTDQTVLPDGTIDLARFGRLVVAGKTVDQIETEVRAAVKAGTGRETIINVRLITPRSAVYYVLGEVNSPGSFPLIGRETVLDGILAAGGISSRASRCNIILSRPTEPNGCRIVLPICYLHIAQMGDTGTNYQLRPGDRIYVASRTLCEQLAFWRSNKECDFCCCCQSQCPAGMADFHAPHLAPGVSLPTESNSGGSELVPPPNPFTDDASGQPQARLQQPSTPRSAAREERQPSPRVTARRTSVSSARSVRILRQGDSEIGAR